jgi:hypothetical protein
MATRVLVLPFFLDGGSSPDFETVSSFSSSLCSLTSPVLPPTFFLSGLVGVNVAGVVVTNVVVVDEALVVVAVKEVVVEVAEVVVEVLVVEVDVEVAVVVVVVVEESVVVVVVNVVVVFVLVVVVSSPHVVDRCEADG